MQIFQFGAKRPWAQNLAPGPNHLQTNCWGSGKSIDTHIVGVIVRKVQIFEFGDEGPLGLKFGPRGPNQLKNYCWGPGESFDTYFW